MGLYDNYRLAQSQAVKQYQGSNVGAFLDVAGKLQERFDTALNIEDAERTMLDSAQVASSDKALWQQRKAEFDKRMAERQARGDYENMVRETSKDAQRAGREYAIFADNAKRVAEFDTDINEKLKTGYIRSGENAQWIKAMTMAGYGGLKYDPSTGQYGNQFQAPVISKEIDEIDFVNKTIEGIKADAVKNGGSYRIFKDPASQVEMMETYNSAGKTISSTKMANVIANAFKSPEMQAYARQLGQIDAFKLKMGWGNMDEATKAVYENEAKALNKTPEEVAASKAYAGVAQRLMGIASKGVYKETEFNRDFKFTPGQEGDGTSKGGLFGDGAVPLQSGAVINDAVVPLLNSDGKVETGWWTRNVVAPVANDSKILSGLVGLIGGFGNPIKAVEIQHALNDMYTKDGKMNSQQAAAISKAATNVLMARLNGTSEESKKLLSDLKNKRLTPNQMGALWADVSQDAKAYLEGMKYQDYKLTSTFDKDELENTLKAGYNIIKNTDVRVIGPDGKASNWMSFEDAKKAIGYEGYSDTEMKKAFLDASIGGYVQPNALLINETSGEAYPNAIELQISSPGDEDGKGKTGSKNYRIIAAYGANQDPAITMDNQIRAYVHDAKLKGQNTTRYMPQFNKNGTLKTVDTPKGKQIQYGKSTISYLPQFSKDAKGNKTMNPRGLVRITNQDGTSFTSETDE